MLTIYYVEKKKLKLTKINCLNKQNGCIDYNWTWLWYKRSFFDIIHAKTPRKTDLINVWNSGEKRKETCQR